MLFLWTFQNSFAIWHLQTLCMDIKSSRAEPHLEKDEENNECKRLGETSMISQLPFKFKICLQCGEKTLCFPNGLCRDCMLEKKIKSLDERVVMIEELRAKLNSFTETHPGMKWSLENHEH